MKYATKTVLGTSLATVAALAATQSDQFANAETYTIKFGDTLSELAEQFNTTVETLRDDNQIEDINWIIAGDTLEVNAPEVEPVAPIAEPQAATAEPTGVQAATSDTATQHTYTVQAGDTLWSIASRFGATVQELQAWNGLSGDLILVGQELIVSPEEDAVIANFVEPSTETTAPVAPSAEATAEEDLEESSVAASTGVAEETATSETSTTSEATPVVEQDEEADTTATETVEAEETADTDEESETVTENTEAEEIEDDTDLEEALEESGAEETDETAEAQPETETEEYIVQPGDTLAAIADRYNVTVEQLRELNNLISDFIFSGQYLQLIANADFDDADAADEEDAQAEAQQESETAAAVRAAEEQAEAEAKAQQEAETAAAVRAAEEQAEAEERAEREAEEAAAQAEAEAQAQAQREAEEAAAQVEAEAQAQAQREAEEAAAQAEAEAQAQAQREAEEAAARAEEQARAEAEAQAQAQAEAEQQAAQQASQPSADGVIGTAMQYLGTGYAWGGSTPGSGFDCSGFVQYVYAQHGVQLPRTTYEQATVGQRIPLSEAQPGDLYFWGDSPYHVAIVMGGGDYIHAPNPQEVVKVDNISNGWTPSFAMRL